MSKYQVEVVETLSRVVEVEAENYDEAENEVTKMYDNEEIVLDWQDLESTEYKQYPSPKMKDSFNLNIEYDKDNKLIWIGNEDGSGAEYKCENIDDLISTVKIYCDNYIELEKTKNEEMER